MKRRDLLACVVALAVVLDERLAVRGDRDDVLEPGHRVADADLDRPEPRVETDVPPDVRVVGDAAGALELADERREVVVRVEARRHARARERREDHLPRRLEPRRLASPERRARRQRQQVGEVHLQSVHDRDRLVGAVDCGMHVHAEDQLAARDVLQLVDERAVAVLGGDALALEEAERVRSGRGEAAALFAGDLGDVRAEHAQMVCNLSRRPAHRRRDLEHRLHQLRIDARLELGVVADAREHRVDVLHEIPRLGIEEHVLLLDAQRVGVAAAELVVEDARFGHVRTITASASISTRQRGSSSSVTMPVVAGRACANASPCALPTESMSSAVVT